MKNEYKVTKALIKSWAKEYHLHGAANIVLFVFWCMFGLIGISGMILSVALHIDWIIVYLYVLITLVSVFKLFVSRFLVWSKRYKLYSTVYGVTEWIRTTEFLEQEIVVTDHTSLTRLPYGNIEKIKEKGNAVMIFMKKNIVLRLYKDAFVVGTWEECKQKIDAMLK